MNNINITKVQGGLGRREPLTDMISGLLIQGKATASLAVNTPVKLTSALQAIDYGFSKDNDINNVFFAHMHIAEFFRVNPSGTLYIMIFDDAVPLIDAFEPNDIENGAKKLLKFADGEINQLGVSISVDEIVTDDFTLLTYVSGAQVLASQEALENRPVQVILSSLHRGSFTDAIDLRSLNSPNVSVFIGLGNAIDYLEQGQIFGSNIGTCLGAISLAKVNEDIAWVQKFNMQGGQVNSAWINVLGQGGLEQPLSILEELNQKGYIFFVKHAGSTGIYFNDSHCCVPLTSDYAYIENNRTVNKASRLIRAALLPYLNSPITVNPTTGKLSPEVVKSIEAVGSKAINDEMLKAGELSGFTFFIDENQNILSTSNLNVELSLVPTGTARQINVNIGFSNPFNS